MWTCLLFILLHHCFAKRTTCLLLQLQFALDVGGCSRYVHAIMSTSLRISMSPSIPATCSESSPSTSLPSNAEEATPPESRAARSPSTAHVSTRARAFAGPPPPSVRRPSAPRLDRRPPTVRPSLASSSPTGRCERGGGGQRRGGRRRTPDPGRTAPYSRTREYYLSKVFLWGGKTRCSLIVRIVRRLSLLWYLRVSMSLR